MEIEHERVSKNKKLQIICQLVLDYPNNYELGKKIRSWYWDTVDEIKTKEFK